MKTTFQKTAAIAMAFTILAGTGSAFAQPRNDNRNNYSQNDRRDDRHDNDRRDNNYNNRPMKWREGGRIDRNDWNRGRKVDFRQHHLRTPPRGYEWRQVDNNYVLAAVATGLIASIILSGR